LPYYHTVRCVGRDDAIITTTGLRATYHGADEGALLGADAERLDKIGYVHGKPLDLGADTAAYDRLMAPAPLTDTDLLRMADSMWAAVNVTKPATARRPNPGVAVADLAKIVADNAG